MTQTATREQYTSAELTEPLAASGALASYSARQQFALTRYARFTMLRRQTLSDLAPDDWRARLIHKALYSAHLDCEASGVSEEARQFGAHEPVETA